MLAAFIIVGVVALLAGAVVALVRWGSSRHKLAAERLRARLAAGADFQWSAKAVPVVVLQKIGGSAARVLKHAECFLASDGFYCIADDGKPWAARVCLGTSPEGPGDTMLVQPPCLISGGTVISPGEVAPWLLGWLPSLPQDGVLLQLSKNVVWHLSLPDPDVLFGMLCLAANVPNVTIRATTPP